jgi:hypothetical protein
MWLNAIGIKPHQLGKEYDFSLCVGCRTLSAAYQVSATETSSFFSRALTVVFECTEDVLIMPRSGYDLRRRVMISVSSFWIHIRSGIRTVSMGLKKGRNQR